jgi:hypothetical protein
MTLWARVPGDELEFALERILDAVAAPALERNALEREARFVAYPSGLLVFLCVV